MFVVVPIEMYSNVLFCVPFDLVFAFFSDDAVKMIDIVLVYICNAKIVDDESEGDIMGFMTKDTLGVPGFDVVMFCEIGDKVVVS